MPTPKPLDIKIAEQSTSDLKDAFDLAKKGKAKEAEMTCLAAWAKIPEPKYNWDVSQITIGYMAELFQTTKNYPEALKWAKEVFKCEPHENDYGPYVLMGTIYFDSGDLKNAKESLSKAFELGGRRAFADQDKKYLEFIKAKK